MSGINLSGAYKTFLSEYRDRTSVWSLFLTPWWTSLDMLN